MKAWWLFVLASSVACNPVRDDAVAALGGEAPGVRRGPLHRPGQPCALCHDGAIGDPSAFSVAGTVFLRPSDLQGVNGAAVEITDSTGTTHTVTTNEAGNFYVQARSWQPIFPLQNVVVSAQGRTATMYSVVGREPSCATCHFDPAGPTSPGHVALELDDGSTPP